jgi:hypothetical protein
MPPNASPAELSTTVGAIEQRAVEVERSHAFSEADYAQAVETQISIMGARRRAQAVLAGRLPGRNREEARHFLDDSETYADRIEHALGRMRPLAPSYVVTAVAKRASRRIAELMAVDPSR